MPTITPNKDAVSPKDKRVTKLAQTLTDMSYYGPYWTHALRHREEISGLTMAKARILLGEMGVMSRVKIKPGEQPLYFPA